MKTFEGLIPSPTKDGHTAYFIKVKDVYLGPYAFASIAIMNKIKEEGRLEKWHGLKQ